MKKKLFAILLAAVMVTALLPTVAFAGAPTEVTKVSITIGEPVVGENLPTTVSVTSDPEDSIMQWIPQWVKMSESDYESGEESWEEAEYIEIAKEGYVYMPIIIAYWNQDYTATENVNVEINGVKLTAGATEKGFTILENQKCIYARGEVYGTTDNTEYLTKYWVTLNAPQVGKTLDFAPKAEVDPDGSIKALNVTWLKCDKNDETYNWIKVQEDEVVEEGYRYDAYLVGTLGENYDVDKTAASVKVNDTVYSSDVTTENAYSVWDGKLAMHAYFEPIADEDETTTTEAETTTASGETTTADGTNPKTGDNDNMFMWIALMAASAAAAGVAVANRRKFSGR